MESGISDGSGWTAGSGGRVSFTAASDNITPVIRVFTGTEVSNLTAVVHFQDPLRFDFDAQAGETYHFQADSASNWEAARARAGSSRPSMWPTDCDVSPAKPGQA